MLFQYCMKTIIRADYANTVMVRTLPRKPLGLTSYGLYQSYDNDFFQLSVYRLRLLDSTQALKHKRTFEKANRVYSFSQERMKEESESPIHGPLPMKISGNLFLVLCHTAWLF